MEPVDEEAAQSTVARLQQFWHKKGDGLGTLSRAGTQADRPTAEPGGDVEDHTSADDDRSDSEGGGKAVVAGRTKADGQSGSAVNEVCLHVACSPHAFCLVEQLEAVLASYGKSRSVHFNRKPILVRSITVSACRAPCGIFVGD